MSRHVLFHSRQRERENVVTIRHRSKVQRGMHGARPPHVQPNPGIAMQRDGAQSVRPRSLNDEFARSAQTESCRRCIHIPQHRQRMSSIVVYRAAAGGSQRFDCCATVHIEGRSIKLKIIPMGIQIFTYL